MKKVSIIIVTYNSEKDIYDCVSAIKKHADIPLCEIELIIVDNNSKHTDTMFANLRDQWGNDIITIKNTRNGGYGQGNNLGIKESTKTDNTDNESRCKTCVSIFCQAIKRLFQR